MKRLSVFILIHLIILVSDEFVYKDSFRHSSWLSLMYDRLILSKEIAQDNSVIAISINEEELFNLKLLLVVCHI